MKKKILKSILLSFILLSLVGTSVIFAETSIGAFSFEFYNNVVGKTKFDMQNKKTTCRSEAGQYRENVWYDNEQFYYKIDIEQSKLFGKTYGGVYIASDGLTYTTDYGTIGKATYTVNVDAKKPLAPYGVKIIGNGTLCQ